MFSPKLKEQIAEAVQEILQNTEHYELTQEGEIPFILHVDGAGSWSWANIRNTSARNIPVPDSLIENLTVSD